MLFKINENKYSSIHSIWLVNILLFAVAFCACNRAPKLLAPNRSFYYWKSVFTLNEYEKKTSQALKATTIYLKYFDVDWDDVLNKPIPKAILQVSDTSFLMNPAIELVPTVFITNECMLKINESQVAEFAEKIKKLLEDVSFKNFSKKSIKEIQIDCDWSAASRAKYFALLRLLKMNLKLEKLSATIRLHQVKYFAKSGIPPVDKGLLMCYNMGNLKNPSAHNSIIDAAEFKKYMGNLGSYPLPLDIALPLFSWQVVFSNNLFKGLLHQLPKDSLHSSFSLKNGDQFEIVKDTIVMGYELKKGDVIRNEESQVEEIIKVGAMLASKLPVVRRQLILFHLDSVTLKKYSVYELENIYNSLH